MAVGGLSPHALCRVVVLEAHSQQCIVAHDVGGEHHAHDLSMPCATAVDLAKARNLTCDLLRYLRSGEFVFSNGGLRR